MIGHADDWIDAYLDGELPASQRQQVEAHLAHCPGCRELLAQRQALSGWLQQVPPVLDLKPEKQFAAEVGLRLARQQLPAQPCRQVLRLGWHFIPVALLLALAFVQAVFILSSLIGLIPGANNILVSQTAARLALPIELPGGLGDLLGLLGVFNLLDWNWLTGFAALTIISLLYLGWLASWWVRSQRDRDRLVIFEGSYK